MARRLTKEELHSSGIGYIICQICLEPLAADVEDNNKVKGFYCERHPWVYISFPGPLPTKEQQAAFIDSIDQNPLTAYIPPRPPKS